VIPEIEERDLGGGWVEGLFLINEVSAYLALQSGIPEATIRARIIEAFGYCKRPPKSGEKVILMDGSLYTVDDQAIRAMQRVVFEFVPEAEVELIVRSYLAEPHGDVFRICSDFLDGEVHHYIVVAVLNNLRDEGRLPMHPSWS
jgi:hypothetical protein